MERIKDGSRVVEYAAHIDRAAAAGFHRACVGPTVTDIDIDIEVAAVFGFESAAVRERGGGDAERTARHIGVDGSVVEEGLTGGESDVADGPMYQSIAAQGEGEVVEAQIVVAAAAEDHGAVEGRIGGAVEEQGAAAIEGERERIDGRVADRNSVAG